MARIARTSSDELGKNLLQRHCLVGRLCCRKDLVAEVNAGGDDGAVMFGPLGLTDDRAARIEPCRCGAKQPRHTFRPSVRQRQPHDHIRVVIAERLLKRCP